MWWCGCWGSLNVPSAWGGTAETGVVRISLPGVVGVFFLVPNWVSPLCSDRAVLLFLRLSTALSLCPEGTRCPLLLSHTWFLTLCLFLQEEEGTHSAPCHETQIHQSKGGEVGRGQSLLVTSQMLTFVLRQMLRPADKYAAWEVI